MTLYELNQAGYAALQKMAKSKVEAMRSRVNEWLHNNLHQYDAKTNIYYMLLNNDTHYFTIFNWLAPNEEKNCGAMPEELSKEIFDIAKDLGTLKSIEYNEKNDSWEFWITGQDAITRMYLLFDYTKGVIEV